MPYSTSNVPNLTGQTVVITGGDSGIGLAAAKMMAAHGACVTIAVRDRNKGETAAQQIGHGAQVRALDLANLASVRAFAAGWSDTPIDILINNAGVGLLPLRRTDDGFEMQIGTNHLGHFALTNLLMPTITGRVVTLASVAHRAGRINLGDLNWEWRPYNSFFAYAQSKLANLLFTSELQRRLSRIGSEVLATAAHPGYAATNLGAHTGSKAWGALLAVGDVVVAQPAAEGALSIVYAAVEDIPGNSYVGPASLGGLRGSPKIVGRAAAAWDDRCAAELWALSEAITGVRFQL